MSADKDSSNGIIGKTVEGGFPVIWKFVNELPSLPERQSLPWLTVISWKYDGSTRNGMPPEAVNDRMLDLEHALDDRVVRAAACRHAYSRTGNHLKELVYYIADRDQFIESLNAALDEHATYPIEIDFYDDTEWSDLQRLLADFTKVGA